MGISDCKAYFNRAMEDQAQNLLLAPYLLGMAQAWKLAGAVDEQTYNDMRLAARGLYEEGRTAT